MTAAPSRERHFACIHPETYKYFFHRDDVAEIWQRLEQTYGPSEVTPGFGVREIQSRCFIFRAVAGGNPITVIRTRQCTADDVAQFHRIVGYDA